MLKSDARAAREHDSSALSRYALIRIRLTTESTLVARDNR